CRASPVIQGMSLTLLPQPRPTLFPYTTLFRSVVLQRPGDDDGEPLECARHRVVALVGHPHPGRPPRLDDLQVPVRLLPRPGLGEPVLDRLGDRRADAVDGGELLDRRAADRADG